MKIRHVARISASNVDKKSAEGEVPVRLCNYLDVYNNERITADLDFMRATASQEQIRQFHLNAGDVLITKDSETPGDIGVPAFVPHDIPGLVCGYHLAIVRPDPSVVDGRYLYWAIKSANTQAQFSAMASGITRFGLRYESIGSVEIPVPPLATQHAIAKFLDGATVSLDQVARRRQQIESLEVDRMASFAQASIDALNEYERQPLKWAASEITVGIVVTPASWYADHGVRAIRGLNVKPGRIETHELVHLTAEGDQLNHKSRLHSGDIVVVRSGQAGSAAVVPPELEGANCIDLVIVRPGPQLDSFFLEAILNSPFCRSHIERYSVGSIQSHFNVEAMAQLHIPLPPIDVQRSWVAALGSHALKSHRNRALMRRQIELLQERRRALVNAAVGGQIPIPGLAA